MVEDTEERELEQEELEFEEVDEGPPPIDPRTSEGRIDASARISRVFTPAKPVSNADLFAGRIDQLGDVLNLTEEAGTHGVIHGERGVGKTSLAAVMANVLLARGGLAARTNCDSGDNYRTIWGKVLNSFTVVERRAAPGFGGQITETVRRASEYLPERAGPGDVLNALLELSSIAPPVIFLDEFDRIANERVRAMFADTIKMLSDQEVPATIVLVGVADTVDELIAEHASVERSVVQIQMPRMSRHELEQIVNKGLVAVGMDVSPDALARITLLSQGLPHYTHLLAQQSALLAVEVWHATEITRLHVDTATGRAIERAQRSLVNAYHMATASPQRSTLYPQVLLAAALADSDELGYFAPSDVRAPLSAIMGKTYEIPSFVRHLHALSEPDRGEVLQKRGLKHRHRFRFRNPLLQPYVVMHGLNEGLITIETFEQLSS